MYCFWGTLFNDDTNNCPGARRANITNVQIQTPVVVPSSSYQAPAVRQTTVYRSIPESSIRQAVENYIQSILPSLRGPQGEPGETATSAFTAIPVVFWNGGGSSVSNTGGSVTNITNVYSSTSSLPTAGASGTVLTINSSGTPEWLPPTYSGTSSPASTTNIIGKSDTSII